MTDRLLETLLADSERLIQLRLASLMAHELIKSVPATADDIAAAEVAAAAESAAEGPLVSIITVTRNAALVLGRALASVKAQTYKNIEILIQDGQSTDNTLEVVRSLGLENSWVSEPDRATLDGLLRAVKRAKGEIIGVCWADDELLPHAAGWAVEQFSRHKKAEIIYGDQLQVNVLAGEKYITRGHPWDLVRFFDHVFYPPFSSSFFKKHTLLSLCERLNEFDHDEYEFWLWLAHFHILYRPGLVSRFYCHADSRWTKPGYTKTMIAGKLRALRRFATESVFHKLLSARIAESEAKLTIWGALHEIECGNALADALCWLESLETDALTDPAVQHAVKLLLARGAREETDLLQRIVQFARKVVSASSSSSSLSTSAHAVADTLAVDRLWLPAEAEKKFSVKKIAILNPYLQGGHTETAEIESAVRFIATAEKYGIEARMVASADEVEAFAPDFAITITYQTPKLTACPTYGLLTMPVSWVKDVPRFVRNILSYDGFLTISDSVREWLRALCLAHGKTLRVAHAAFSLQKTCWQPVDFANATAVYVGTNWDQTRHADLFRHLANSGVVKCFGPRKSWENYPAALYGGEIPFDGISSLLTYRLHGAGLLLNHADFDREGIPSSRTFEIAAAGALPVCTQNACTEAIFADSVLYVDKNGPAVSLAQQMIEAVHWIRANPLRAAEMAHEAHQIFCEKISMDVFLENIIEMHEQRMESHGISSWQTASRLKHPLPLVAGVVHVRAADQLQKLPATLESIAAQAYPQVKIVLICPSSLMATPEIALLRQQFGERLVCVDADQFSGEALLAQLKALAARWLTVLVPGDRVFPGHFANIMRYGGASFSEASGRISGFVTGSLAYSMTTLLADCLTDSYSIQDRAKSRIASLPSSVRDEEPVYLHASLINVDLLDADMLNRLIFLGEKKSRDARAYFAGYQGKHQWVRIPEMTTTREM